jgi:hypothetical protein
MTPRIGALRRSSSALSVRHMVRTALMEPMRYFLRCTEKVSAVRASALTASWAMAPPRVLPGSECDAVGNTGYTAREPGACVRSPHSHDRPHTPGPTGPHVPRVGHWAEAAHTGQENYGEHRCDAYTTGRSCPEDSVTARLPQAAPQCVPGPASQLAERVPTDGDRRTQSRDHPLPSTMAGARRRSYRDSFLRLPREMSAHQDAVKIQ